MVSDGNLPQNGYLPVLLQISIDQAEMMVAEEAVVGAQRRRMNRGQHQMAAAVDGRPLLLRVGRIGNS